MTDTSFSVRPNVQPTNGIPRLQLRNISKSFGGVQALKHVDFEVFDGEVVGLVGDNGAGKSTLIKTMSGAYIPDEGEVLIDNQPVTIQGPQDATRLGIETVYQDLALCDNLDVVANLWLGREAHRTLIPGVLKVLDEAEMERRTIDVLRTLDVKIPSVRSTVAGLSGGQRQCVAVAKTILRQPKVVLLDEPTAALGVAQTRQVLNMIHRLKQQGQAVVVISHNLHDVFEVTDRIVVMRLGQRVRTFETQNVNREAVVAAITGADAAAVTETDVTGV
ncbi:ATP-binding cassette domain-containing protein [Leptolyngbya sp. FACHB-711]|uniref:ATP-binding cassette domain-containing protein n=1 Tax=unclassified Leptolyngbya TaxID=2650499 RepID=UPI0016848D68|nr:ATP-binding cassette domain-containing protein [Leptolyngbya sp. FACHB-711]MBD1849996.1 sugar ABC transporter ATP-binding protein [Cyanobacteria bacterium FACHB-502]MBD2027491.1 sugar ABC transporter ATP-binding protein [Leptolyngbya sp. FACHB-711]